MQEAFAPGENPNNLMTVQETSEYLRTPLPTIYYLLQNGKLPGFRIGGRWRVKKDAVDRDILGKDQEIQQNVTLALSDASVKSLVHAVLKGSPAHISESAIINGDTNRTIITDGNLAEQFGPQINDFRGRVIMIIADTQDTILLATNLQNTGGITAFPLEHITNPKIGLRAVLNLPRN